MRTVKLNKETKKDILANLLKRSTNDYGEIEERVKSIIERVRTEGDSAVYDYARQFDRCAVVSVTDPFIGYVQHTRFTP